MAVELVFARQERPAGLSTLEAVEQLAERAEKAVYNAADAVADAATPVIEQAARNAADEAAAAAAPAAADAVRSEVKDDADRAEQAAGAVGGVADIARTALQPHEAAPVRSVTLPGGEGLASASDADAAVFEDSIGQRIARLTDGGELQAPAVAADRYGVGDDGAIAHEHIPGWHSAMVDELGFVYAGLDEEGVFHGGAGTSPEPGPPPPAPVRVGWSPGPGRISLTAHRGVHLGPIPENSLDGLFASKAAGFEWVETDVRVTADGHYVLLHDATLDRTCRLAEDYSQLSGVSLSSLTLSQLRSDYVLASSDPAMRQPVPTLAEYLDLCCNLGLRPFVELKAGLTPEQVLDVAGITAGRLEPGGYIHNSFSPAFLDAVHAEFPEVVRMYNIAPDAVDLEDLASKKPVVWTTNHALQTPESVAAAHAYGLRVNAFTVPEGQLQRMLDIGLDMSTTDNIAPSPPAGSVVASVSCRSGAFDDLMHTGTVAERELVLAAGQSASLTLDGPFSGLGGAYADLWFQGSLTFSGSLSGTYDHAERAPLRRSLLFHGPASLITITAGPGGATIRSISLAIAHFL